ncbi:Hpt domain-containing protein [Roseibium marinum]|uniref:Hpt domain-containing protein n=1 Tax=Roseibium marinum TaxID=281252 RepID=A0A2S3UQ54_9HYPH|nr:Hpt domain-containing protein [Roseibium marinum]POF29619.1 Hpt domain-containing protein [Roseibium marinum]
MVSAFERRLDNDKGELVSSISSIHDSQFNAASFDNVRYIAHRINGGAGLFDCNDLAEPAKEVEKLVDDGADTDLLVNAVQELIDRIERLLADGIRQPEWITSRLEK